MGLRDFTVTPGTTGTTSLYSLIGAGTANIGICKQILIQADPGNSGVMYVGGTAHTITTTAYGVIIPIPVTNIPAAPLPLEANTGLVSLGEVVVKAANTTDKCHILCITN